MATLSTSEDAVGIVNAKQFGKIITCLGNALEMVPGRIVVTYQISESWLLHEGQKNPTYRPQCPCIGTCS